MSILAAFMVPHPPLIIPQVGRGGEAQIAETAAAYERVADEIAMLKPDTVIITSPHTVMYADYFSVSGGRGAKGSFSNFGAPQVNFDETYDTELVNRICALADEKGFPAGTLGNAGKELDHGTMVPLYFIRKKYKGGMIVRIGLSGLPLTRHYELGMIIKEAVEQLGRRTVFVASGDLSHKLQEYGPYGFAKEGPEYDRRIMDVCSRGAFGELLDFDDAFCEKAAECGHRSFVIMTGVFDAQAVKAEAYSHQDITGVGYGICGFYPEGEETERQFLKKHLGKVKKEVESRMEKSDNYVKLAKDSIENYILKGTVMDVPDNIPDEMKNRRAGVFVSIHEHGKLRGCIGTIRPAAANVAEEIIENAVSASTRDPRFDPIRPDELQWLEINVDVLGDPEDIESEDQLDVKRYGVIVSSGGRRGLLLPDLEGIDTVEDQISIARQKAGIYPDEKISLQRFEVIRHV